MRELDLHKEKEVDKSKQKNDAKNAKPKSVLEVAVRLKYCAFQMTSIFLNPCTIFVRRVAVSR